jgi:anaerobic ribonucleoside-triphosphate reductase activating protein
MLDFEEASARDIDLTSLVGQVRRGTGLTTVEGITLLGGEPFHQAPAASVFAAAMQGMGLSVVVFTGYTFDLLSADPAAERLLSHTDLLISGPYIGAERSVERPWLGSANQEVHLLTDRYRDHPDLAARRSQSVHIQLVEGELRVSGWPSVVNAVKRDLTDSRSSDED